MWMWMWIWNVSEENWLSCVSFCQGCLLMIFDSIYFILIVRTRVPYYIGIKWYNIITCILFSSLTFQIHIHIHIFSSEVTCYFCYFCYRLTILLPLNCVPTQPLLRRDAVSDASGGEVKNIRMQAAIPRDALSDSSNIFLSYTGLLIFCPCVRQQYKM